MDATYLPRLRFEQLRDDYGGLPRNEEKSAAISMRQMKQRSVLEGVEHHKANPVREYAHDGVQEIRINKARRFLAMALVELGPGRKTIVELGCGVLEISGPFSKIHEVIGAECNEGCIAEARTRYPQATIHVGPIEEVQPFECDILILCEILEHLEDPAGLVRKWLPKARACVISHPIGETLDSPTSGGDHCWSFSENDLFEWFPMGGHALIEYKFFQMGSYRVGLARGWRNEIPSPEGPGR